jgi:hypothetical protein
MARNVPEIAFGRELGGLKIRACSLADYGGPSLAYVLSVSILCLVGKAEQEPEQLA